MTDIEENWAPSEDTNEEWEIVSEEDGPEIQEDDEYEEMEDE